MKTKRQPADHVRVYKFHSTPKHWQDAFADNGGDEDWLAIVPPSLADEWIGWLEGPSFGCCCVDIYKVDDKGQVLDFFRHGDQHMPRPDAPLLPELAGCTIHVGCHA